MQVSAELTSATVLPESGPISRASWAVAWSVWTVSAVAVIGATALILATISAPIPPRGFGFRGWVPIVSIMWATIGARIAGSHWRNPVGWLLLLTGLTWSFTTLGEEYATFALFSVGQPPSVVLAVWYTAIAPQIVAGLSAMALLLIPDGRLMSWRSRVVAAIVVLTTGVLVFVYGFTPRELRPFPVDNPFGLPMLAGADETLMDTLYVARGAMVLLPTSVLLVRLRRARGERRQQLKWVASAGALAAGLFFVNAVVRGNAVLQVAQIAALVAVPAAFAFAIQRYRLYDIDIILNRALVYGSLTAVLGGTYIASIGLMQRAFVELTGERSDAAVIVTTFLVASAFAPMLQVLQRFVDRRFKHLWPSVKGIDAFTAQLEDHLALVDEERLLSRCVDECVAGLGASGGALQITTDEGPRITHTIGRWTGQAYLTASLTQDDRTVARILLGPRVNGNPYTRAHRQRLQQIAELVARAVARI